MIDFLILSQPVLLVACGVYIMETEKKRKAAARIAELADDLVKSNAFLEQREWDIRVHLIEDAIIKSTHEQ